MRRFFYSMALCTLLLSFAVPAMAQGESSTEVPQLPIKINQGNWEIGGEGNYFRSNESGGLRLLTLTPRAEYFIMNRFSVGGRINYIDSNRASTEVQVGPGFSWYIMQIGRSVLLIDQAILWVNPSGSEQTYFAGDTGLGIDFFLSPSVAVGPSIRGLYYFGGDSSVPEGGVGFRIGLSVFL